MVGQLLEFNGKTYERVEEKIKNSCSGCACLVGGCPDTSLRQEVFGECCSDGRYILKEVEPCSLSEQSSEEEKDWKVTSCEDSVWIELPTRAMRFDPSYDRIDGVCILSDDTVSIEYNSDDACAPIETNDPHGLKYALVEAFKRWDL